MRRKGGSALLCTAIVLLASGCGSTLDPVAAAATKTGHEGGSFKLAMNIAAGKDVESIDGDGVFDANGTTRMTLEMLNPVTFEAAKVEAVATSENGDDVFYLKIPALTSQLPPGKTWARIDLTEAAKKQGLSPRLRGIGPASDPTQVMQLLKEVSGGVTKVGSETVLGIDTTRYHANLELTKLLELEGLPKSQVAKAPKAVAAAKIPADVWVDSDGYLRQFRLRFSMKRQWMTMRMTVTEIGAQEVSTPPADQTVDVTDEAAKG